MFSLQDKSLAQDIISRLQKLNVNLKFMHVCGTHQDTLVRHGLDNLLKDSGVTIGQGPGCPVCVTTPQEIEEMITLARRGKYVATFGDMIRVPGQKHSLQDLKTDGYHVHTVYSIEDAVSLAKQYPNKDVVFMAVGFETTAPTTAATLLSDPPANFSILSCHRTIPAALQVILEMGEIHLDGFIEPGHVSTIIGSHPYEFLSKQYHLPQVITGFEPLDVLMAVWMLVMQIQKGEARVENEYSRAVNPEGNIKAQQSINKVFSPCDIKWRGFPVIPQSGLEVKEKFSQFDARKKFEDILKPVHEQEFKEPKGCRCGEVLRGLISSQQCPLFGKACTPESPVGPCMVSAEGSCTIEYRYSKK